MLMGTRQTSGIRGHAGCVDKGSKALTELYREGVLEVAKADHPEPGPAMQEYGGSNSRMARFTRMVLNHAPIGSFRARFFPQEPTNCNQCNVFQTREHILFNLCQAYKRRWRHNNILEFLRSLDPFPKIVEFMDDNEGAFAFTDAPQ